MRSVQLQKNIKGSTYVGKNISFAANESIQKHIAAQLIQTLKNYSQKKINSYKIQDSLQMKRDRPKSLDKQQRAQQKKKDKKPLTAKQTMKTTNKIGNFDKYDSSKEKQLGRQYFRQQVVVLAKDLLGKVIVHQTQTQTLRAVIVETQAYKAPHDKGCHAYNNKKTDRTKYFWLDGGHLYIYTIYMPTNICLNVVAGLQNEPEAVLIRAVQPVDGIDQMISLRNIKSNKLEDLSNGPGKVGQCLGVDKQKLNGIDLTKGKIRVVDAGLKDFKIGVSKRINIDYAQQWIQKPWRFFVQDNSFVSKVNPDAPPKPKQKK